MRRFRRRRGRTRASVGALPRARDGGRRGGRGPGGVSSSAPQPGPARHLLLRRPVVRAERYAAGNSSKSARRSGNAVTTRSSVSARARVHIEITRCPASCATSRRAFGRRSCHHRAWAGPASGSGAVGGAYPRRPPRARSPTGGGSSQRCRRARPTAPWANAARHLPSRFRTPGLLSAALSDVPGGEQPERVGEWIGWDQRGEAVCELGVRFLARQSPSRSSARAGSGRSRTSSSGAGVATTATRSTRSGRRAASERDAARETSRRRRLARRPRRPARPRCRRLPMRPSASRPRRVGAAVAGRSTDRRVALLAISTGSGSKLPEPGALWQKTTSRSSAAGQSARAREVDGDSAA